MFVAGHPPVITKAGIDVGSLWTNESVSYVGMVLKLPPI